MIHTPTKKVAVLKRILKRMVSKNDPLTLIFFVTSKCDARCKMCFYYNRPKQEELSINEIRKISKGIPDFPWLILTGGEPFLRKDLAEICKIFYKQNNVYKITIPTNGFSPGIIEITTRKILNLCKNAYIKVNLSIDDLYEKHDEIREVSGGFDKVLATYQRLKALEKENKNLQLGAIITVSKYNQENLIATYEFLRKMFDPKDIVINLVRGVTRRSDAKEVDIARYINLVKLHKKDLMITKRFYDYILGILQSIQYNKIIETYQEQKRKIPCYAGRLIAVIDELGNVYPCELLDTSFGKLRENEYNFKKLWKFPLALQTRKTIEEGHCFCTHECFIWTSIISSPQTYFLLAKRQI